MIAKIHLDLHTMLFLWKHCSGTINKKFETILCHLIAQFVAIKTYGLCDAGAQNSQNPALRQRWRYVTDFDIMHRHSGNKEVEEVAGMIKVISVFSKEDEKQSQTLLLPVNGDNDEEIGEDINNDDREEQEQEPIVKKGRKNVKGEKTNTRQKEALTITRTQQSLSKQIGNNIQFNDEEDEDEEDVRIRQIISSSTSSSANNTGVAATTKKPRKSRKSFLSSEEYLPKPMIVTFEAPEFVVDYLKNNYFYNIEFSCPQKKEMSSLALDVSPNKWLTPLFETKVYLPEYFPKFQSARTGFVELLERRDEMMHQPFVSLDYLLPNNDNMEYNPKPVTEIDPEVSHFLARRDDSLRKWVREKSLANSFANNVINWSFYRSLKTEFMGLTPEMMMKLRAGFCLMPQGTVEWIASRRFYMTGTPASGAMNHNPYSTPLETMSGVFGCGNELDSATKNKDELCKEVITNSENDTKRASNMKYGHDNEPNARKSFRAYAGMFLRDKNTNQLLPSNTLPTHNEENSEVDWDDLEDLKLIELGMYVPDVHKCPELESFAYSPDDILVMPRRNKVFLVEYKCPATQKPYKKLPSYYMDQVQLGMGILGISDAFFVVWTPKNDLQVFHVPFDPYYFYSIFIPFITKNIEYFLNESK